MRFFRRKRRRDENGEIAPEDIFLDSSNLPGHQISSFEGRVERAIPVRAIVAVGVFFMLLAAGYGARAFSLQVVGGARYAKISQNNTLEKSIQFATRGLIYDRTGRELAWNAPQTNSASSSLTAAQAKADASTTPYALRRYSTLPGLSVLLGFVQYPKQDTSGTWWRTQYQGLSGVELAFNDALQGENGSTMVERDAHGAVERENLTDPPRDGADLTLTIDADVQSRLYTILARHAAQNNFQGGAGIIIDVRTGEILAITSFPEYNNQDFTDGDAKAIAAASRDPHTPLLDRAISGLYAPGSIVKPIFAAAALNEHLISPDKQILSTGAITLPNPYDPAHPSIFRDWKVHGWIDMRTALAVSSDEYFYTIGGGYGGQQGLGITKLDQYARRFGLGSPTGIALTGEKAGVIPTPAWKAENFPSDSAWRIGDTYHTSIGQYGFQITPIQAARYVAAIANGGTLFTPQILASTTAPTTSLDISDANLEIVREGMRMAVTSDRPDATVKALNMPQIHISAKTGTAQLGTRNQWMNSWSVGFWPAENPHYAYAVVLEHAPAGTASGAAPGMAPFFDWLASAHPEYTH